MSKFTHELKKQLYRSLPQSNGVEWSRRIEGALVGNEEKAPHEYVTVIVDSDMSDDEYGMLVPLFFYFIKKDLYYKHSKYRILLWKNDELKLVSPLRMSQMARIKENLDAIKPDASDSNHSWEAFRAQYKPHKNAGQVILFTTHQRVESLDKPAVSGIRNLLIVYCGMNDSEPVHKVSDVTCIAYIEADNRVDEQ